jgi:hypothetical protein
MHATSDNLDTTTNWVLAALLLALAVLWIATGSDPLTLIRIAWTWITSHALLPVWDAVSTWIAS